MDFYFIFMFGYLMKIGFIFPTVNSNQLFNLKACNKSMYFNLDLYNSLIINGSFVNLKRSESTCQLSFLTKDLKTHDLILFNLQLFETIPLSKTKSIAALLFSARGKGLFQFNLLHTDMIFRNVFITELLNERNYNWNNQLQIDLKIYGISMTNMVLVITPGYFCSNIVENEMFRCEDGYKENNICIANHFRCDGWNNCPYRETDESQLICHSQFVHHILIPSLILSSTVFVLGWILLKLTPCILEQRRLFLVRRNHLMLSTLTTSSINGRMLPPYLQNFSFSRRISDNNLTPENIPNSPPKYQNIYQPTNSVDHHLPPSYSEETDIGVIPDFFKRFFGKMRKQTYTENPENVAHTNSKVPKSLIDSQSDNNRLTSPNKQDMMYITSTDSDTLTSITSTDVYWGLPTIGNTHTGSSKK